MGKSKNRRSKAQIEIDIKNTINLLIENSGASMQKLRKIANDDRTNRQFSLDVEEARQRMFEALHKDKDDVKFQLTEHLIELNVMFREALERYEESIDSVVEIVITEHKDKEGNIVKVTVQKKRILGSVKWFSAAFKVLVQIGKFKGYYDGKQHRKKRGNTYVLDLKK